MSQTPTEIIAKIRRQLAINVEIAERDHPEGPVIDGKRIKGVAHSQDLLAQHIRDHLNELEQAMFNAAPESPSDLLVGSEPEAIEAAKMARTRLMNYANAVQRGEVQGGGREFERRIWGAFSDFDQAVDALASAEVEG